DGGVIAISETSTGGSKQDVEPIGNTNNASGIKTVPMTSGTTKFMTGGAFLFDTYGPTGANPLVNETGYWIKWTVTYTDKMDGVEKSVSAYTYVYKTFYLPVVAAAYMEEDDGTSSTNCSTIAYLSGIHSIGNRLSISSGSNAYYANSTTAPRIIPALGLYDWDGYVSDQSDADSSALRWLNQSNPGVPYYPSTCNYNASGVYYDENDGSDSGHWEGHTIVNSPVGILTVDSSRYKNLSNVPNLIYGCGTTSNYNAEEGGGALSIKAYKDTTGNKDGSYVQTGSDSNSRAVWNEDLTGAITIKDDGTDFDNRSTGTPNDRIQQYNGAIKSSSDEIAVSTGSFGVRYATRFHGKNDDYVDNYLYINFDVTAYNKQVLRDAVNYAISKSSQLNPTFYDTTHSDWTNYTEAFEACSKALTQIDGAGTYTSQSAINTAADNLETYVDTLLAKDSDGKWTSEARKTGTLKVYHVALITYYDANGNLQYGGAEKLLVGDTDSTGAATYVETREYFAGDNIYTGYNETPGYSYFGYHRSEEA
ncbi:MAG: hypothetical protein IJZ40_07405, partial [Bacteroidaceae bacterium]|nr:hypothetical protein [Bacteroidaceae bacterium]